MVVAMDTNIDNTYEMKDVSESGRSASDSQPSSN